MKQDHTYPLIFRISHAGVTRDIKTGYAVTADQWNSRANFIKDTHPLYKVVAPRITELQLQYLTKLAEYEKVNQVVDIQEVKEFLLRAPQKQTTIYNFWQEEIEQLYLANRSGGAQVYKEALIAIDKVRSLQIPFEKLDYTFLKAVEAEFLNRGAKQNTFSIYCRTLRAIYNKAINAKIVSYEFYPFRSFKIRREPTVPRPISLEEIKAYFNVNIDSGSYLYDSWLMGQLMFMLIGINFKDLILLRDEDLKADRVFYKRAKTKKLYSIKLLPRAQEIITYFKSRNAKTLIGVLTEEDLVSRDKLPLIIRQRNKVYNSHLGKVGKLLGSREKLTGYVFRYSWANIAKHVGCSKDLISEALGHSYGNSATTSYLNGYDLQYVDEMNQRIYDSIVGK